MLSLYKHNSIQLVQTEVLQNFNLGPQKYRYF